MDKAAGWVPGRLHLKQRSIDWKDFNIGSDKIKEVSNYAMWINCLSHDEFNEKLKGL